MNSCSSASACGMGYAAAIIVVLLAVLALLALVQFGLLERRIHYR